MEIKFVTAAGKISRTTTIAQATFRIFISSFPYLFLNLANQSSQMYQETTDWIKVGYKYLEFWPNCQVFEKLQFDFYWPIFTCATISFLRGPRECSG